MKGAQIILLSVFLQVAPKTNSLDECQKRLPMDKILHLPFHRQNISKMEDKRKRFDHYWGLSLKGQNENCEIRWWVRWKYQPKIKGQQMIRW